MKKTLLAVFFLAAVAPSFAQQDEAGARRAIAAVQETLKQRPNDATLHFFHARFQAELGDAAAATAALEKIHHFLMLEKSTTSQRAPF